MKLCQNTSAGVIETYVVLTVNVAKTVYDLWTYRLLEDNIKMKRLSNTIVRESVMHASHNANLGVMR